MFRRRDRSIEKTINIGGALRNAFRVGLETIRDATSSETAGDRWKLFLLISAEDAPLFFFSKTSRMLGSRLGSKRESAIPGNGGAG